MRGLNVFTDFTCYREIFTFKHLNLITPPPLSFRDIFIYNLQTFNTEYVDILSTEYNTKDILFREFYEHCFCCVSYKNMFGVDIYNYMPLTSKPVSLEFYNCRNFIIADHDLYDIKRLQYVNGNFLTTHPPLSKFNGGLTSKMLGSIL